MKKITEQELASELAFTITKAAEDTWPAMYKELSDSWGNKFFIKDQAAAESFFVIAVVSLWIKLLKDVIIAEGKPEQADRIYNWVIFGFGDSENGSIVKNEIDKNQKLFSKYTLTKDKITELIDATTVKLLHQWLGGNFEKNFIIKKTEERVIVSPLILGHIRHFLLLLISPTKKQWEEIKENYILIDSPIQR